MSMRKIYMKPMTKSEWLCFLRKILRSDLMKHAYGDQPDSDGLVRSLKDIMNVSDGSAVYRVGPITSPRDLLFYQRGQFLDYEQNPISGTFMIVDTGLTQVLVDLQDPDERVYVRQFERVLMDYGVWAVWKEGSYELPADLEALEQQLRV